MPVQRRGFLRLVAGAIGLAAAGSSVTGLPAALARPQLPGVRPTRRPARTLPKPTAALVTRWDADPWSRGSYSALPPGTSPSARRALAGLVLADRVVLAGEYASSNAPATTHGALASGDAAARRLLDRLDPDRVLVVGAGIAGAAAAARLRDAGVEVVVLEARERIGGRIHANTDWGAPIEMGAAWIHGITDNPVTTLARGAGLPLVPMDWENAITRDTVTGKPSPAADQSDAQLLDLMDELADAEPPLSTSTAGWLRNQGWSANRLHAWAQAVEISQEYGLDPAALGVRAFSEGDWQRGGDVLVGGDYATVVQQLLAGIEVRLRTPVTSVLPGRGGIVARGDSGLELSADGAIIAVPVALLQAGIPNLGPLPGPARTALAGLRTGSLEKVVLRYAEQWWGEVRAIGVVGGGAPGAPAGSQAALRWTELVSISDLVGFPAVVAFSGGSAARTRPASDASCVAEAVAALEAAFRD